MDTDNFAAWQQALIDRDRALFGLLALSILLVGSYLFTYAKWVPPAWGKRIRLAYEIGGALLYIGTVIVCARG